MKIVHPSTPAIKPSSDEAVRQKFLNVLGISSRTKEWDNFEKESLSATPTTAATTAGSGDKEWTHPRMQNLAITQEPLKYNPREALELTPEKRRKKSSGDSSQAKPKKRCNFNETVEVVPIPMRNEYSNRVKSRLWNNAMEIHENAARNALEFASEGWDWRNVVEDDEMYICSASGELVHPIHYEPSSQEQSLSFSQTVPSSTPESSSA
jgi:hypothetical protein